MMTMMPFSSRSLARRGVFVNMYLLPRRQMFSIRKPDLEAKREEP